MLSKYQMDSGRGTETNWRIRAKTTVERNWDRNQNKNYDAAYHH